MKIVHVLNSNKFSGAEKVVIQMIHYLCQQNIDVYYVSLKGPIEKYLKKKQIKYYLIDKMNRKNIKRMTEILKPDIIHAHDYTASIICAFSVKQPIISHLHNNSPWIKKAGLYSWVYAISSFRYQKILLVSSVILKEYVFSKWIAKKCKVIGNPIEIGEIIEKSKENIEESYDISFMGRLSIPKNPILLLEVLYELKKYFPELRVCIIGDGELREQVKDKCRELDLEKNITWTGFLENPFPYIRKSKIFLLPSLWEGYGLAAVEALALGKPVVCCKVGGLNDIVDKRCGFLCRDKKELVLSCKKLLKDKKLYEKMESGALERAKELNNIGTYINMMKRIYKEINIPNKK